MIRQLPAVPPISAGEMNAIESLVDGLIGTGMLKGSDRSIHIRDMIELRQYKKEVERAEKTSKLSTIEQKFRPERGVLDALLEADNPEQIRALCTEAFQIVRREVRDGDFRDVRVPAWPIADGSTLPEYLSQYAEQFIAAKKDPRFPRSNRPTNRLKQLWFLSRALAGACCGLSTRTSINLVGSKRPEQIFEESNAGKPTRKTRKKRVPYGR